MLDSIKVGNFIMGKRKSLTKRFGNCVGCVC